MITRYSLTTLYNFQSYYHPPIISTMSNFHDDDGLDVAMTEWQNLSTDLVTTILSYLVFKIEKTDTPSVALRKLYGRRPDIKRPALMITTIKVSNAFLAHHHLPNQSKCLYIIEENEHLNEQQHVLYCRRIRDHLYHAKYTLTCPDFNSGGSHNGISLPIVPIYRHCIGLHMPSPWIHWWQKHDVLAQDSPLSINEDIVHHDNADHDKTMTKREVHYQRTAIMIPRTLSPPSPLTVYQLDHIQSIGSVVLSMHHPFYALDRVYPALRHLIININYGTLALDKDQWMRDWITYMGRVQRMLPCLQRISIIDVGRAKHRVREMLFSLWRGEWCLPGTVQMHLYVGELPFEMFMKCFRHSSMRIAFRGSCSVPFSLAVSEMILHGNNYHSVPVRLSPHSPVEIDVNLLTRWLEKKQAGYRMCARYRYADGGVMSEDNVVIIADKSHDTSLPNSTMRDSDRKTMARCIHHDIIARRSHDPLGRCSDCTHHEDDSIQTKNMQLLPSSVSITLQRDQWLELLDPQIHAEIEIVYKTHPDWEGHTLACIEVPFCANQEICVPFCIKDVGGWGALKTEVRLFFRRDYLLRILKGARVYNI